MSQQSRALFIGLLGPSLQALGVAWDLLEHVVLTGGDPGHITLMHILAGPAHLIIFTGFALSLVCIPIALQVAAARPEELEYDRDQRPLAPIAEIAPALGPVKAAK